jgi:ABC-type glycerol-3-phosphate transport system substrate-binding protein
LKILKKKKHFHKKYGYPLATPKNLDQLIDVAEFFTRKKGETLAGKPLIHDFFGLTLMSGNRPHINDEFSAMLWGLGGSWFKPFYNDKKSSILKYRPTAILHCVWLSII